MNKTIIINISGTIFHIEEDAYDVLRNYMSDVKRYFGASNDSFEIVTDIENRIAELFTEILKNKSGQVIIMADVQQVISQMGQPVDFQDQDSTAAEPLMEKEEAHRRKLYRDTDDKVLGGVCAGLGYYFGVDVVWIRVFFALLVWVGGFTIIAYIVLWIAMPPARTRAEKLAMAGEKINLETIRNSVESEFGEVQERIKKFGYHLRSAGTGARIGDFIEEFASLCLRVGSVFGKILLVALGLLSIIFSIALIIGAFAFAIALIVHPENAIIGGPVFLDLSPGRMIFAGVSITLLLAIPALFLLLVGIRLLVKRSLMNGLAMRTLMVVWIFALAGSAWTGISIAKMFSEEASITQEIALRSVPSNTFYLKPGTVNDDIDSTFSKDVDFRNRHNWHIGIERNNYHESVNIEIEKQDTGKASIQEIFTSRGFDSHDALKRADRIKYHFQQKDSVLSFPSSISWNQDPYRVQKARVILRIPVNTTVFIDPELSQFYYPSLDDYEQIDGKNNIFIMTPSGLKPKFLVLKKHSDEDQDSADEPKSPTPPVKPPAPPVKPISPPKA